VVLPYSATGLRGNLLRRDRNLTTVWLNELGSSLLKWNEHELPKRNVHSRHLQNGFLFSAQIIRRNVEAVFSTPALYPWGPGFKSRHEDWMSWEFSLYFSIPPGKREENFNLGHDRFLPYPFQFIIHQSLHHSTLWSLICWLSLSPWLHSPV